MLVERTHFKNTNNDDTTKPAREAKQRKKRQAPQPACEYLPGCWKTSNATCQTTTAYNGTLGVTRNAYYCQNWMSNTPNLHSYHIGNFDYCRDPDGSGTPWCYTTSTAQRWDYCFYNDSNCVSPEPICEYTSGCWNESLLPFCKTKAAYRGYQNMTVHGTPCQNWSLNNTPHVFTSNWRDMGNHNNCRNPDSSIAPWCYTMDPQIRFDYCFIPGSAQDCALGSSMSCFDNANDCWYENATLCNSPYYSKLANRSKTLSGASCVNWLTTGSFWIGNISTCV